MESLPPRIVAAIHEVHQLLADRYGVRLREVRLFGSWAWGRPHAASDIDLFVVIDGLTRRDHVAVIELVAERAIERNIDLAPLVWSTERYQRGIEDDERLARTIATKGIPL